MLKPKILNFILTWFLKYILYYLALMFLHNDYYFVSPGIRNTEDLIYYLLLFSGLPLAMSILLTLPIHIFFKSNKAVINCGLMVFIILVEYILYTFSASSSNLLSGILNGFVSIFVFYFLFYKHINPKFSKFSN